ncbi:MAG TPA: hypothetical protein VE568_02145 [Rubrobacter sp.]|nr:hypothetical protein [Rubrobacter sp.]
MEVAGGSGYGVFGVHSVDDPVAFPSTLAFSRLEGGNCIGPVAPALEGPMFAP